MLNRKGRLPLCYVFKPKHLFIPENNRKECGGEEGKRRKIIGRRIKRNERNHIMEHLGCKNKMSDYSVSSRSAQHMLETN